MGTLLEESIQCPYCWETLYVNVETSDVGHHYVEDCHVCCRPIQIGYDSVNRQVFVRSID